MRCPSAPPYSALTGYKYRVKLTPGRQKKGKAARSAMEMLLRGTAEVSAREKELMKAVTDAEDGGADGGARAGVHARPRTGQGRPAQSQEGQVGDDRC